METYTMYITVNGTTMTASMVANSSTAALKELLSDGDISIEMSDYANFEKVGELPQSLPTNNEQITTEPGDLILYLGRNFVIYYDTNTWNFTRLGKIDGLSEQQLKEILGTGDCVATLSLTLPSGIKETGDDNGRGNAYYRIDGTKAGKSAKGLVIDRNTSTKSFRR